MAVLSPQINAVLVGYFCTISSNISITEMLGICILPDELNF